ncbi:PAS domain-containing sensor histidine kinase [Flavobacterium phycosphaerae]|uniref:PAS domain-containing sensor histidine kinase n=1 Tax=Flavobacterium phycosphaerae TaxID=2697515 RepID=UPI0013896772|nr:PAS domain-containing sensor histidine kinase [Flavobacterium phycosphaerae]
MKNSELLQAIVQNAIDGIITIDTKGIIEHVNPSASKLFGYEPSEMIGRNISMLMPPPDSLQHDQYLHRYDVTHKPRIIGIGREVTGLRKDGTKFPMQLGVSEVHYTDQTFYVGFIHDLTQQKEDTERLKDYALHLEELVERRTQSLNDTIQELENAKEQISISLENEKELNRLKSRFLSMASHEFRTPLSAVLLSASLIDKYAQPFDSKDISKHIGKIKSSVAGLTFILNNFLQLEKLESGKVAAAYTDFDLSELGEEIAEEMQLLVKGAQIITYQHKGQQTQVTLDKNLLKNSIVNLITNAVKYSGDNAKIEFITALNDNKCTITVKDNGIGIPKEDQKYLFDAFFRAHNTGSIPGTGLGLNIVARHVSLMGGEITFNSTVNEGTVFTLLFDKL